jgi:hypothetical protein
VFCIESFPDGEEVPRPISPGAMTLSPTVSIPPSVILVLPLTVRGPVMVVVARDVVPDTVNPPVELMYERSVPPLLRSSRRLVDPCPAPACIVSVVVPVVGVSFEIKKDMLDSRRLVILFHLITALGLTRPLKKTSDMSSVSVVMLFVLRVKSLLVVPEILVDAPEMVLALMLST